MPRSIPFSVVARPFFAAFISVGVARIALSALMARFGESSLITLVTIGFCAVIYLPIALLLNLNLKNDTYKKEVKNEKTVYK